MGKIITVHNSTYPKVAVQSINRALCFYQSVCLADSEVVLNRHLRVAVKTLGTIKMMKKQLILIFLLLPLSPLFSQNVWVNQEQKTFNLHTLNLFDLAVKNVSCEDLYLTAEYGQVSKTNAKNCTFQYWNNKCISGTEKITVYKVDDNDTSEIETLFFLLSDKPLQSVSIDFKNCRTSSSIECIIEKNDIQIVTSDGIKYYPKLAAELINWNVSLYYEIDRYSLVQTREGKIIHVEKDISGTNLTEKILNFIQSSISNDKFKFYDVYLKFEDCELPFEGPEFKIK